MTNSARVAIYQSEIIPGGRLRVILGLIEILNEAGIVPDIRTGRLLIDPESVTQRYGKSLRANFCSLPRLPKLSRRFAIPFCNLVMNHYSSRYDLLLNSNNTLIFLPKNCPVVTYMHFPHEYRIASNLLSLHRPDTVLSPRSRVGLQRVLLRGIYRLSRPQPHHVVVCNSEFTRDSLLQIYPQNPSKTMVINPPVDLERFKSDQRERERAIVSVGRFGPDKRQFEQIQLAERLPDIPFHLVGFVNNTRYFQQCEHYVQSRQLSNVHLHPNASFSKLIERLHTCKYFLHTLINEPFGITSLQALAAGCLPIVHDSGGQREVVPKPELRYQHLEQVPDILERMETMEAEAIDSLVRQLQEFVTTQFNATAFYDKMKSTLAPYL
ncbi:MAG: glycosyltransferase [Chloroflexia bacterium]|nr:glycosyltransferase [Chloroflexia bacterium]